MVGKSTEYECFMGTFQLIYRLLGKIGTRARGNRQRAKKIPIAVSYGDVYQLINGNYLPFLEPFSFSYLA